MHEYSNCSWQHQVTANNISNMHGMIIFNLMYTRDLRPTWSGCFIFITLNRRYASELDTHFIAIPIRKGHFEGRRNIGTS